MGACFNSKTPRSFFLCMNAGSPCGVSSGVHYMSPSTVSLPFHFSGFTLRSVDTGAQG